MNIPPGSLSAIIAKLTIKSLNAVETIKRGFRDDEGAALVEYGMLVGLIAVVCIVAVTASGEAISDVFERINTKLATLAPLPAVDQRTPVGRGLVASGHTQLLARILCIANVMRLPAPSVRFV